MQSVAVLTGLRFVWYWLKVGAAVCTRVRSLA